MKRGLFLLGIVMFSALPLFAQSSEFGVILGGSKRLTGAAERATPSGADLNTDPALAGITNTGFRWSNRVKEVYYAVETEPQAWFKVKVGEIDGSTSFQITKPSQNASTQSTQIRHNYDTGGKVQYVDGIGEYRFSEPFGSTGLFLGIGLYRQQHPSESSETNYGFVGGVNGDFPLTRRLGFIIEAAFHETPFHYTGRYATLGAGLRFRY